MNNSTAQKKTFLEHLQDLPTVNKKFIPREWLLDIPTIIPHKSRVGIIEHVDREGNTLYIESIYPYKIKTYDRP